MANGYVIYEGPSMFDGEPIVGVVTIKTTNTKTGNVPQLWILRADMKPMDAIDNHQDQSICGGCKHRHNLGGACYVLPFQGPTAVYKAYTKDRYSRDIDEVIRLTSIFGIRLGAYGDPAMLPAEILRILTDNARFHLGYTHQWKNKRLSHAVEFCQGSVDTKDEYDKFKKMYPYGFTFRVTDDADDLLEDEVECLADSTGISCVECKLCDGSKRDVTIAIHGAKKSRYINQIKFKELV